MAQAAIISWTPANWITVVLMVGVTFVIVGAIARTVQQRSAAAAA
jgi:hypothetical protein